MLLQIQGNYEQLIELNFGIVISGSKTQTGGLISGAAGELLQVCRVTPQSEPATIRITWG